MRVVLWTMKLWIRSDLHTSLDLLMSSFENAPEHDVAILAGDIAAGLVSQIDAIDSVASKPVILVAGNHEFWHRSLPAEIMAAGIASKRTRHVRFLENDAAIIDGVRFLGATFWTDFSLYGHDARSLSMAYAQASNLDFKSIFSESAWALGQLRELFTPADSRQRHLDGKAFIEAAMAQNFAGPTVVVTHHAPLGKSLSEAWKRDPGSPAYASNDKGWVERMAVDLWIHGHLHDSVDYMHGKTRVISNPAGFYAENLDYDPDMIVEV